MEILTESVDKIFPENRLFINAAFGIIFFREKLNVLIMDILMIVLSLIAAYVLFVSVCYLLIRLLFPKIEVSDSDEVRPLKNRNVNRYAATRTVKKQKNLAY